MNKELYKKYADIKARIAALEEERRMIEIEVLDAIDEDNGGRPVETPFGKFFAMGRTTYEYSEAVKREQARVLEMKHKEEDEGVATVKSMSRYVRLLSIKE